MSENNSDQENSTTQTSSTSESISKLWEIHDPSGRRKAIFVTALGQDIAITATGSTHHMLITPEQSTGLAHVLTEIHHAHKGN